jgi:aquaporin Z
MDKNAVKQRESENSEQAFLDASLEWRHVIAEAWGTFLLVLVAVGGPVATARTNAEIVEAASAVAPGLMVMVAIYSMGAVSGAHLNPAVSFAFALRRNFPWRRVPAYVLAQIAGALIATLFLRTLFGPIDDLGATKPGHNITAPQACVIEVVLTAALVTTILGTASGARNVGANAGVAIGAYIALAGMWASPLTGASMNMARSLAPDLMRGDFSMTWIYIIGPLFGAGIGVALEWTLKGPPTTSGNTAAQGEKNRR